ncbi:MAG: undecaprenyldiphospho-muramoylpentapeptide beta-N-acetylglucosaminyltransferase [Ignavibacteriae bacterium]|jgi:UDP-N-acetylglucosamine--N-acetylmuramyl-(pentapeptide) pyrophosphoryl-undecaprenol N-acetylglucosamine transferase|nr:undecaprenyldiphospho-muramoylpentapeptide beta-N-acetylglucosaminyltransferase [Ignavibacteriota bacterium]NOG97532.1 undecaprenyldiphospho-muramoylpentapeptide beta-N-acetylglucosaminyltransferase [Ignavibacteriota bacterium]
MSKRKNIYRFIFAGGGTGGHLYPAIAVAEQIRLLKPEAEILFVGTKHKIEARVVPQYKFDFKTIWISGFARKLNLKNLLFPIKLFVALIQSLIINIKFKPRTAIGTGAYVAGPIIWAASVLGSKIILLEQNSYPGVTNRLLEKRADEIHISFEDSREYFREKDKLMLTGNPLRINLKLTDKKVSRESLGLQADKKTLLVFGGSLGARSLNEALKNNYEKLLRADIQIVWQAGELYFDEYRSFNSSKVKVVPFFDNMSEALSAADLIVARAGATSIAELSYLGLPVVFVPSTNVSADHQYKNAHSLEVENAAVILRDNEVSDKLYETVTTLIKDEEKLKLLSENIKKFSKPDAAKIIAGNAIKLAERI